MLKAIIFDFDGVIANTEPVHLRAFQEVLKKLGVNITRQDYYEKYLALDDKTFFASALNDWKRDFDKNLIEELMLGKSGYYDKFIKESVTIFPGVVDFLKVAHEKYALAIGSGALRHEIESILKHAGIREQFDIIVSAEDVENCKPDPEVFLNALRGINALSSTREIKSHECLVVEDSLAGIKAAHSAGMKCLAVANSYPQERLSQADLVLTSLKNISVEDLESLF